ncbi:MAG: hypothetical protein N2171_04815 [Clostridia bacterium]|nr:hypothetical protein [Clostridia bacterium]
MKNLKELSHYMNKQVKVVLDSKKEYVGLCWGVYGSVQNDEEYDINEDSIELMHDGECTVFYSSEIDNIELV